MARRILAAFTSIVAGGILGHLVYRLAVVPRLADWLAIPLRWYPALLGPLVVGFVAAGLVIRSMREVIVTACLVGLVALLPGGHDADPGLNFILAIVLTAIVLSMILWLANLVRHRNPPV